MVQIDLARAVCFYCNDVVFQFLVVKARTGQTNCGIARVKLEVCRARRLVLVAEELRKVAVADVLVCLRKRSESNERPVFI